MRNGMGNLVTGLRRALPLPTPQHYGHHDDVHVVNQAGGQEFADGGRAAPAAR
jgi:hypothetical protein